MPSSIVLREVDSAIFQTLIRKSFIIAWIGDYTLYNGDTELIRLINEKQHTLSGSKINEDRIYCNEILKRKNGRCLTKKDFK